MVVGGEASGVVKAAVEMSNDAVVGKQVISVLKIKHILNI